MHWYHSNLTQFKPLLVTAERNTRKYNKLSPKPFYELAPIFREKKITFVPGLSRIKLIEIKAKHTQNYTYFN